MLPAPAPTVGGHGAGAPTVMDSVALRLRVLGHPTRLLLIAQLARGPRTVGELADLLGEPLGRISKHLRELHRAGLVWRGQEGNFARYGVVDSSAMRVILLLAHSAEAGRGERTEVALH